CSAYFVERCANVYASRTSRQAKHVGVARMTVSTPAERLLLSPAEAARALSISPRTLWSLTAPRGPISVVRCGRSVRYAPDDLRRWIDAQTERGQEHVS